MGQSWWKSVGTYRRCPMKIGAPSTARDNMSAAPTLCPPALHRAGLRSALNCGDSATAPPTCSGPAWTTSLQHDGWPFGSGRRRGVACAQHAFEQYLCQLPGQGGRSGELRPADWAFGAEPPTVGKFVARVAMQLYLGAAAASPAFRPLLPREALRQWSWRPPLSSCPPHVRETL